MNIAKVIAGREQSIVHCTAQTSVRQAAQLLAEHRIGAMPVLEDGRVVGIFSERDLLYCVARDAADALKREVGSVMTSPAITVDPQTDALEALQLMTRRRIRHLPVMDGDKLTAFVSIGDLVKFRIAIIENEAQAMREYITAA